MSYQLDDYEWKEFWQKLKSSGISIPDRIEELLNEEEVRQKNELKRAKFEEKEYYRERYYKEKGLKFTPKIYEESE